MTYDTRALARTILSIVRGLKAEGIHLTTGNCYGHLLSNLPPDVPLDQFNRAVFMAASLSTPPSQEPRP